MAFPQTTLDVTVELQLTGVWTDITQYVYLREPLTITWGRQDWASRVNPSRCPMQINNIGGQFSPRNPHGPYFGILTRNTPVRIFVTLPDETVSYRFAGEIRAWPNRWDLSGNDRWVQVEAFGLLRRYEQGNKPLYDSLRRHIEANGPLAYWPLTDGETAVQGSEVAAGGQPMRAVGEAGSFYQGQPNWGRGSLAPWLDPVVELPDETTGRIQANVRNISVTGWSVDYVFTGGGQGATQTLQIFDTGDGSDAQPQKEWTLLVDHFLDRIEIRVTSRGETTSSSTLLATVNSPGIFDDDPHHLRLSTVSNGSSTSWQLYVDGVMAASGTHAVTHRPVARITYRWDTVESGGVETEALALGHIAYWSAAPDAVDAFRALGGYDRERAGRRLVRLCAEQGVVLQTRGDLDDTPLMGPQRSGAFLDLLRAAEEVDGGVLGEARDQPALSYRTRTSKYNQGV